MSELVAGPSPKLSVCVAAYNEAATIWQLLEQLLAWADDGIDEILVCANGCTDDTEAIVSRFIRQDPRVRLILSPKGKPAAWNVLMRTARNDFRLFLDADVKLAPGFVLSIHDAMHRHPAAAIIAARDLPRPRSGSPGSLVAALASRSFGFDYVCGRAYVLRLTAVTNSAGARNLALTDGIPDMPSDVVHEDFWLEVAIGRRLIAFAPSAVAYYDAGSLNDLLKSRARLRVARSQVARVMPDEFARWQAESRLSASVYQRLRHRMGTMYGTVDFLACVVGSVIRSILMSLCSQHMRDIESTMQEQMARQGGHAVLSGSGRLSKTRAE